MAWILYDWIFVLESTSFYINIHLIEETFDNVDFTCPVNVPSLVISVIRLMNYQFFTLLLRCLGNINQLICIS